MIGVVGERVLCWHVVSLLHLTREGNFGRAAYVSPNANYIDEIITLPIGELHGLKLASLLR